MAMFQYVKKVKVKGSSLDTALLTILDSCALQPRKWQLTVMSLTVVPWHRLVTAQSPR